MNPDETLKRQQDIPIPAVMITTQVVCDDGRTIQMQTGMDRDSDRHLIDYLLDKMLGASDRQKALYKLPALRHELDVGKETLENAKYGLAVALAQREALAAEYEAKAAGLVAQRDAELLEAQESHVTGGRRGRFRPPRSLARFERVIAEMQAAHDAALAKADEQIRDANKAVAKWETSVAICTRAVADTEELMTMRGTGNGAGNP